MLSGAKSNSTVRTTELGVHMAKSPTQTADQLNRYLASSGLMASLQSAYRACHSTETALLRVMSHVFATADQQRVTLLGLLDLSAEFDHNILLLRLEQGTI